MVNLDLAVYLSTKFSNKFKENTTMSLRKNRIRPKFGLALLHYKKCDYTRRRNQALLHVTIFRA